MNTVWIIVYMIMYEYCKNHVWIICQKPKKWYE